MNRTVNICYKTMMGGARVFSHSFTGDDADIAAEIDRMLSLPDVMSAWFE